MKPVSVHKGQDKQSYIEQSQNFFVHRVGKSSGVHVSKQEWKRSNILCHTWTKDIDIEIDVRYKNRNFYVQNKEVPYPLIQFSRQENLDTTVDYIILSPGITS